MITAENYVVTVSELCTFKPLFHVFLPSLKYLCPCTKVSPKIPFILYTTLTELKHKTNVFKNKYLKYNKVPEVITNLLWLMYSTGIYITAIKQYLRRHADKLHPISAWLLLSFVLKCVCLPHVVQCPVISYHHSVRSAAEQTAICFINTNVCMCVWESLEDGGGGGLRKSDRPIDKGSGQICPADMEEFI